MDVLVWVTETTWTACVDAVSAFAPDDAAIALLYVTDEDVAEVAHGGFTGLLGRSHQHHRDPGRQVEALSAYAADVLLVEATERLGRPAVKLTRHGRVEHEVVAAAAEADLLICGRDGNPNHAGPHSIAPPTRFVLDHAICPVLLVWSQPPPRDTSPDAP
jgi:nucleotide-binding universal stress UspA family protein